MLPQLQFLLHAPLEAWQLAHWQLLPHLQVLPQLQFLLHAPLEAWQSAHLQLSPHLQSLPQLQFLLHDGLGPHWHEEAEACGPQPH